MSEVFEETELQQDTQKGRFLTFSLGKERYGIEICHVTEIIGMQTITGIPELPDYIKGIINLRGKIIPVMDFRLLFKKEPMEYNDRSCIVVVEIENTSVGLIVDSISEVLAISEENIVPPPKLSFEANRKYIKAIGTVSNLVILILDCNKLLFNFELQSLNSSLEAI